MQFKMIFQFGNQVRIFPEKFHHVRKVQAKKYHCYFVEHSVSKGNNQGTKKNGIPAALKRGLNTNTVLILSYFLKIIFLLNNPGKRVNF